MVCNCDPTQAHIKTELKCLESAQLKGFIYLFIVITVNLFEVGPVFFSLLKEK